MIKFLFKIFILLAIALLVIFAIHKEKILKKYKELKKSTRHFRDWF
jgi:hypothetical protein